MLTTDFLFTKIFPFCSCFLFYGISFETIISNPESVILEADHSTIIDIEFWWFKSIGVEAAYRYCKYIHTYLLSKSYFKISVHVCIYMLAVSSPGGSPKCEHRFWAVECVCVCIHLFPFIYKPPFIYKSFSELSYSIVPKFQFKFMHHFH